MAPLSRNAKGIAVSLLASGLFGLLYYYATLLAPLEGTAIFGWRVLFTLPFLTIFMCKAGFWAHVTEIATRIRRTKGFLFLLFLSACLLGVQFWLFLWAPANGRALQVALGYLLMPLVMVVCGMLVYKDQLLPFQKLAVAFAVFGVGSQVYHMGGVFWESAVVAVGFPLYFMLRRKMKTDNLGGLWFDMLFMVPVAIAIIQSRVPGVAIFIEAPRMVGMLPLLGAASALSVGCYIMASKLLPFSLFGLLSYVEPILLVAVSLILGERIAPEETLTYVGVGLAVAVLALGGARRIR